MLNEKSLLNEEILIMVIINEYFNNDRLDSYLDEVLVQIDWDNVFKVCTDQKILNIVYQKIKDIIPDNLRIKYKTLIEYNNLLTKLQIEKAKNTFIDFQKNNIENICIVKGFVISQIIYEDPYLRQFNDIDIFASENEILASCDVMEKIGYKDREISIISNNKRVNDFIKHLYYCSDTEKKFIKEYSPLIEIKKAVSGFDMDITKAAIEESVLIDINGYKFRTFNLEYTFMYMTVNLCHNFYSEWGIYNEYTVRDIFDYYCFIIKYKYIFTPAMINTINEQKIGEYLTMALQLLKEFFNAKAVEHIPKILLEYDAKLDSDSDIKWNVDLRTRIYDRKERIDDYNWFMYKKVTSLVLPKALESDDIGKYPYDYESGNIEAIYPIWMPALERNLLDYPIMLKIDYSKEHIYYNLKILNNYPV